MTSCSRLCGVTVNVQVQEPHPTLVHVVCLHSETSFDRLFLYFLHSSFPAQTLDHLLFSAVTTGGVTSTRTEVCCIPALLKHRLVCVFQGEAV